MPAAFTHTAQAQIFQRKNIVQCLRFSFPKFLSPFKLIDRSLEVEGYENERRIVGGQISEEGLESGLIFRFVRFISAAQKWLKIIESTEHNSHSDVPLSTATSDSRFVPLSMAAYFLHCDRAL